MKLLCSSMLLVLVFTPGCSSDDGNGRSMAPGRGKLGDGCQRSEDCASTLCADIGVDTGICTQACRSNSECPAIDNWECVGSSLSNLKVCGCRKLSLTEICGDNLDNDCNGVVDDCRACNGIVAPLDDPSNCGTCGNECRFDQSCNRGTCVCPASAPTDCGVCTDTTKDTANCGACGNNCGEGANCVAGKCQCPPGASESCAGAGCIDLKTSSEHCGTCDNECTLGQICKEGTCACPAQSEQYCPGVGCIDPATSPSHCGGCDIACSTAKVCSAGQCTCPTGKLLCGDTCVDLKTDTANCG
ncbi:MAG TPA: hypothetical protein VIV60_05760, partial [Polyangiaceae bacterium]